MKDKRSKKKNNLFKKHSSLHQSASCSSKSLKTSMTQHQQRSKDDGIICLSKSLLFLIKERNSKYHEALPSQLELLTLKIGERDHYL